MSQPTMQFPGSGNPEREAATRIKLQRRRRGKNVVALVLSLAAMAAGGIPPGFNVITGALYEKDRAAVYDKILSAK